MQSIALLFASISLVKEIPEDLILFLVLFFVITASNFVFENIINKVPDGDKKKVKFLFALVLPLNLLVTIGFIVFVF